jgi:hypothetical protein
VDKLASQMDKLVPLVQQQEKGRSNGQDSQGSSNHPRERPQPVNGGYLCTRHPSSKLAALKNSLFLHLQSWKDHIPLLPLGLKTVSTLTSTTLTATINLTSFSHIQNTSSHLWSIDTFLYLEYI